ncbi:MAG: NAD-dependent deacetylase [Anaerolineae bacterium]
MITLNQQIQAAADLILQSRNAVALTGAGSSTLSGIPDFRSPGSGLWNRVNPMEVASIMAFRQRPQDFYDWVRPLTKQVLNAKPNPGHFALARLEEAGKLKVIITQNIDGLHQAANSKNVLEVHGHIREVTCVRCYKIKDAGPVLDRFLADGNVPHCECGGILKPNVILFGEQLPVQTLLQAKAAAQDADLMLIAGSSLEVVPIADLPYEALRRGAKIVIVNYQETHIDSRADVVIHRDLTEVLPKIADLVIEGLP